MSREKQIEFEMAEMLEIIEKAREIYANDITDHTENEYIREGLLDAGYRKQEWISVEERLPEQGVPVLVYKNRNSDAYGNMETAYFENGRWRGSCGEFITHWMPLPEAPKMKGGTE